MCCTPRHDQRVADVLKAIAPWSPCSEGVAYLRGRTDPSWRAAWCACRSATHMLWLVEHAICAAGDEDARRWLRLCGVACAATVLPHTTDPRAEEALVVAWRWSIGDATDEERAAAASAVWSARSAVWSAVWSAASAARSAAESEMADIVRAFFPEPPFVEEAPDAAR